MSGRAPALEPRQRLRLAALLTACGGAGFLLALPFLWPLLSSAAAAAHRAPALIAAIGFAQILLLCAVASWGGVVFAPRTGLDAPWFRAVATGAARPRLPILRAAVLGTAATIASFAAILAVRRWAPPQLWTPGPQVSFWRTATSAF